MDVFFTKVLPHGEQLIGHGDPHVSMSEGEKEEQGNRENITTMFLHPVEKL